MSSFQTALSSARFNRYLMWFSGLVLAAGVAFLLIKLVPGNDKTQVGADKGFVATAAGEEPAADEREGRCRSRRTSELDPEVRATIRTFLATAVARRHLDKSWAVIAPSMKQGYTFQSWSHAKALPVVPYPIENVDSTQYYLDYASTKEILLEVGVSAPAAKKMRPVAFQLGLVRRGKGAEQALARELLDASLDAADPDRRLTDSYQLSLWRRARRGARAVARPRAGRPPSAE